MFKKKQKIEEVAKVSDVKQRPEEKPAVEEQPKLLIELTEPERFVYLYSEIAEIKALLQELINIAKTE